jgi:hypothetical protein
MPGDVANPGSWNLYGYVEGDPVNFRDPTGLNMAMDMPEGGGGGGGGLGGMPGLSNMPVPALPPPVAPSVPNGFGLLVSPLTTTATGSSTARNMLQSALSLLNPHCQNVLFGGPQNLPLMRSFVNNLTMLDARPDRDGNRTVKSLNPGYPDSRTTVAELCGSIEMNSPACVMRWSDKGDTLRLVNGKWTGTMVLTSQFWGLDAIAQPLTLIHEMVHLITNTSSHSTIAFGFGILKGEDIYDVQARERIDTWLKNGCR